MRRCPLKAGEPQVFCHLRIVIGLLLMLAVSCRSRALLEQAQMAADQGNHTVAVEHYEKFLQENPGHEKAEFVHFQAGNICLLSLKQYDKAATHYIQLIEASPGSPNVYLARQRLARAYTLMGKRRDAISAYENLLRAFPGTTDRRRIRLEIADLYFDQNDLSQARIEYQKVLKDAAYDSLSELAYLQTGKVCVLLNDLDAAIPAYQNVVASSHDPEIVRRARLLLADCYQRTLRYEDAVAELTKIAPNPQAPEEISRRITVIRELQKQRGLP
jgi:tetratricopeptide (TPR) repeat protein